eukprot:TRINITY_DN14061_c0_g1_i1.p1 TRINITY_DN14061_c0_g1~~TRINITY_DN14061_c0_g1_i1.p1  ORF type:complete len:480 (+),score=71.74 TRINITY_DN14061_c0_g1_i1:91-1530(+)
MRLGGRRAVRLCACRIFRKHITRLYCNQSWTFAKAEKKFADIMTETMPHPPEKMAIAVSGGADSMALSLLTKNWISQQNANTELFAYTVDHQLREDSKEEAQQVKSWLDDLSINSKILTGTIQRGYSLGVSNRARDLRYSLIREECEKAGIHYIFVGHHANDNRETFFMRLFQFSAIFGLGCIQPFRKYETTSLARPLLQFSRKELENVCKHFNQPFVQDPSNLDADKSYRNRIRQSMPHLTSDVTMEELDGLIREFSDTRNMIESTADQIINTHFEPMHLLAGHWMKLKPLLEFSKVIQIKAIQKFFTLALPPDENQPTYASVRRVVDSFHDKESSIDNVSHGASFFCHKLDRFIFVPPIVEDLAAKRRFGNDKYMVWGNYTIAPVPAAGSSSPGSVPRKFFVRSLAMREWRRHIEPLGIPWQICRGIPVVAESFPQDGKFVPFSLRKRGRVVSIPSLGLNLSDIVDFTTSHTKAQQV